MSSILVENDPQTPIGDLDELSKALAPDATTVTEESGEPVAKEKPEWCPDKFFNAETGEVDSEGMAKSYTNLESLNGRRANEVGELRKLTDGFLGLKREVDLLKNDPNAVVTTPKAEIKATDLLERPREILDGMIAEKLAEHDAKRDAETEETEVELAEASFYSKHPNPEATVQSEDFISWVRDSRTRARLALQAQQGDLVAADDLLTEFGEINAEVNDDPKDPEKDPVTGETIIVDDAAARARKVSLETGSVPNPAEAQSTKVYRRADLIKLKLERPEEYSANEREILLAYSQGRVR